MLLLFLCAALFFAFLKKGSPGRKDAYGSYSHSRGTETEETGEDPALTLTRLSYQMDGLDRNYRILLTADLHIIVPDDPQVDSDVRDDVAMRRDTYFRTPRGIYSCDLWKQLPGRLDEMGADGILFAGDMIDYCTEAQTKVLGNGFSSLKTPWMYVRGDHDYAAWYSRDYETQNEAIRLQAKTAPRKKVMKKKIGRLTLIGWDNSTSQMTEEGLGDLKKYLTEAKEDKSPVLFLCHVPLLGDDDSRLAELSDEKLGRVLLWGDGDCFYKPDQTTQKALDMIMDKDSPVRLVCCGHLHFPYTGMLTKQIPLVVTAPAFEGKVTELHLTP